MQRSRIALIATTALAWIAAPALAQSCNPGFLPAPQDISADGPVFASTSWDPDGNGPRQPLLVVAGAFDHVSAQPAQNIAAFDPVERRWTQDLPGLDGAVRALLTTEAGVLYAAGEFLDPSSGTPAHVAKWNGADWTMMLDGPNGIVWALAEAANGDLIAGGLFDTAGGAPASNVAKWTGTQWLPLRTGTNGTVRSLATFPDGTIYAGGEFDSCGVVATGKLARWNGNEWSALPTPITTGTVHALAPLPDGSLAAGGEFTVIGGTVYRRAARLANNQWYQLGWLDGTVYSLSVHDDGSLWATGSFPPITSGSSGRFARWNGTAWESFRGTLDGTVYAVAELNDQEFIVAGTFTTINGLPLTNLAFFPRSLAPAGLTNGAITNVIRDGHGACIVVGSFTTIGGVAANRIARWDGIDFSPLGDGLPPSNQSVPADPRAACVLRNGDILVAGSWARSDGSRYFLMRWDSAQWTVMDIGVSPNGWAPPIDSITELPNGDIIFGGRFMHPLPNRFWYVGRWDGQELHSMGEHLGNFVTILRTAPDGQPIAGGGITDSIRQWTGTYWRSLAEGLHWTPGGYTSLTDLEILPNGDLLAVGGFNDAGGLMVNRLARWDSTDWLAVAPNTFTNGLLQLEVMQDGTLVGMCQASSRYEIRTWDGVQTRVLPIINNLTNLTGITELNGEIILYGAFARIATLPVDNFARYSLTNTPWTARHPEPVVTSAGETVVLAATPATGYEAVRVRWQRNGAFIDDGPGGAAPGGGEVAGADALLGRVTDATPALLTITNAQYVDGGEYTAVFSNACGSSTSRAAAVTINPACSPCPADYDNDGGVTGGDLAAFISEFEQGLNCADVNMDGGVSFDDLAMFIIAFEVGGC